MIKKTFILIPAILLFTACSDKTVQLQLDENKKSKVNSTTLSYNDYKSSYESQNQKLKNRPHSKYEPTISKDEYEKLSFNSNEINEAVDLNSLYNKQAYVDFYSDWKNVRYKMGGTSRLGIDCSGFTQKIFKEKFGIELPRTTLTQVNMGVEVKKSDLRIGDLVFFKTSRTMKHVGVYWEMETFYILQ